MKNISLFIAFSLLGHMSMGQLKKEEKQSINTIFSAWNQPNQPGGALGIIKNGKLVYSAGYGMANLEHDIPNSPSTVFRIGSSSKQFTAACIILLTQQGKISLDDSLKSFFPAFPNYAEQVKVRHLLNHTSGIRDYMLISYLKGHGKNDFFEDSDVMKWLVHQEELNFKPGEEFLYSNSGYWLLGKIVKKASGMDMADFAKKYLFKPLGMNNTHFHNDHTQVVKHRATGYVFNGKEHKMSITNLDMIGDGGVFTSIHDIKKWDDAFYSSDVLNKEFWNMMTQKAVLNNGKTIRYASGLFVMPYKGLNTIRHDGAFHGYRAEILRFPDEQLSIVLFTNRGDTNSIIKSNQVAEVLLKDKFVEQPKKIAKKPVKKEPVQELELNQMVGSYEVQPGIVVKVSVKEGALNLLEKWSKQSFQMKKLEGNTFQIPEQKINFSFSNLEKGKTQTLTVLENGRETIAARKKEIDMTKINLSDFAGNYYSKELDVAYTFELVKGILEIKVGDKKAKMQCVLTEENKFFVMRLGFINFLKKNDSITGFTLDSGRVKNLKFQKA